MPTQRKIEAVEEMRKWMEECTIAISTDYTGMDVVAMTNLRSRRNSTRPFFASPTAFGMSSG